MWIRFSFCLVVIYLGPVLGWDSEQLEVFDVVEEVKENFYNLLNISKDATGQEIRGAFRSLSLKLHPDKNLNEDTSIQFRNLVSVYEVLKSGTKRKYYDEVLVNGLPNWRSAVYYYRYVRKIGLMEVCILLFVNLTIGQYLVKWASYLEKKYNLEQTTKKPKRNKKPTPPEDGPILAKPSIRDTLPFQIPRLLCRSIASAPAALGLLRSAVAQQIEAGKAPAVEPPPAPARAKPARKRKAFVVPEGASFETTTNAPAAAAGAPPPAAAGGLWTDDDLAELTRLVKRHPGGSAGRWEAIAAAMARSVAEVAYMAHKLRENRYRPPNEEAEEEAARVKVKTKREEVDEERVRRWSQAQQRAFEEALSRFPKGSAERWEHISELVPGKTKEECMVRFRYLAESVKKQHRQNDCE